MVTDTAIVLIDVKRGTWPTAAEARSGFGEANARLERQEQESAHTQPVLQNATTSVLVVEDEPLILMSTVDMVSELGHTVHDASSAKDALAILEAQTVDVLRTDVGLPGMLGTDFDRQVRERWPAVRIVFASGDDSAKTASVSQMRFSFRSPSPSTH